jgi:hypothetical protein
MKALVGYKLYKLYIALNLRQRSLNNYDFQLRKVAICRQHISPNNQKKFTPLSDNVWLNTMRCYLVF